MYGNKSNTQIMTAIHVYATLITFDICYNSITKPHKYQRYINNKLITIIIEGTAFMNIAQNPYCRQRQCKNQSNDQQKSSMLFATFLHSQHFKYSYSKTFENRTMKKHTHIEGFWTGSCSRQ